MAKPQFNANLFTFLTPTPQQKSTFLDDHRVKEGESKTRSRVRLPLAHTRYVINPKWGKERPDNCETEEAERQRERRRIEPSQPEPTIQESSCGRVFGVTRT